MDELFAGMRSSKAFEAPFDQCHQPESNSLAGLHDRVCARGCGGLLRSSYVEGCQATSIDLLVFSGGGGAH